MYLEAYEKEHLQRLRKMLPECMVLLKSDGTFPISKPCKVALYGNGARKTIKGGTGSGEVNSRFFVNVEDGLKNAGFEITSSNWLEEYETAYAQAKKDFQKEIKRRAKEHHTSAIMESMGAVMPTPEYELSMEGEGELCIYVLSRNSGEGNDRDLVKGDILLTDTEVKDILEANRKYERFLLVLNVGGPVDLSPVLTIKNIILLSQLGVETGDALSDVILGKTYPSGKLASSWAFSRDLPEIGEFGDRDETSYKEGVYVGYRYYDSLGIINEFPFGYGLSYTDFELITDEISLDAGNILANVRIRNIGRTPGKEAVQLYISLPEGELDQPYQTLAAFGKTKEIQPGEEDTISLSFNLFDIAPFSEKRAAYILEKGDYVVRIGNSSVNTKAEALLRLDNTVELLKVRNACGRPDFEDYMPADSRDKMAGVDLSAIRVINITASELPTKTVVYDKDEEIAPFIDGLSDEELAFINIGNFDKKAGIMNVIGEASIHVAGAAGETTNELSAKGMPYLVMADGPAGVRLSKKYAKTEERVYPLGTTLPDGMAEMLPGFIRFILNHSGKKPPKNAILCEQYATAIPIGTAIAQSFNCQLARECGDIVGAEMERFGVHLWLAPALNIHRSMRCGRNFEYYSEDPLVSGVFAAAITNGVQAHKGCGTTIKHYCANNQEYNRYGNNSQVSERAMREIYLKGFGICVRASQPKAVMTSYNLLNGVHTSERRDLTMDILRREFGFEGIVMTDWVVSMMNDKNSKHRGPYPYLVASAGGDLFMPGSKKDYANMLEAVKSGKLDRKQLKINATRVYKMAKELTE